MTSESPLMSLKAKRAVKMRAMAMSEVVLDCRRAEKVKPLMTAM